MKRLYCQTCQFTCSMVQNTVETLYSGRSSLAKCLVLRVPLYYEASEGLRRPAACGIRSRDPGRVAMIDVIPEIGTLERHHGLLVEVTEVGGGCEE